MTLHTSILSLKLPPEVAKIMPWITSARMSGRPNLIAWAKSEYDSAFKRARERERHERQLEEEKRERQRQQEAEEERWQQHFKDSHRQRERWSVLGIHFALEDGWEEIQPTHSSTKGFRRILSEFSDERNPKRYYAWGGGREQPRNGHRSWRNQGRKPRKP